MGAICRLEIVYEDLCTILNKNENEHHLPVYGTFLEGKNIYTSSLSNVGIIVMGNEGNGISKKVEQFCTHKLNIPNFPIGSPTSESLNVAMATSIVCSEFRRRIYQLAIN